MGRLRMRCSERRRSSRLRSACLGAAVAELGALDRFALHGSQYRQNVRERDRHIRSIARRRHALRHTLSGSTHASRPSKPLVAGATARACRFLSLLALCGLLGLVSILTLRRSSRLRCGWSLSAWPEHGVVRTFQRVVDLVRISGASRYCLLRLQVREFSVEPVAFSPERWWSSAMTRRPDHTLQRTAVGRR
jgi:hypothetical protein